jgi:hypothetical protein
VIAIPASFSGRFSLIGVRIGFLSVQCRKGVHFRMNLLAGAPDVPAAERLAEELKWTWLSMNPR